MIYRLLLFLTVCSIIAMTVTVKAQSTIVFQESFDDPPVTFCEQGNLADGFISINGLWTVTGLGVNDSAANEWYISATEPGVGPGFCASPGCHINPVIADRTLHIGNVPNSPNAVLGTICPTGDCGAVYDPGTTLSNSVQTLKRVESPKFLLPGSSTNILVFNYLDFGDYPVDSDKVFIDFYNGTTWQNIGVPSRTNNSCGAGLYKWERYSINLPTITISDSVKIGFRWQNDNGGSTNSRPSFAVDTISVFNIPSPPVADFTQSDTDICVNDCVAFLADTVGPFPVYSWTFPGSNTPTSNLQNPSVCYFNPGTYTVQLTVTTSGGTSTKSSTVIVNPCSKPTADFVASDSVFCERSCITFTDASTNGATGWSWSFPGGIPSSSSSPSPPPVCYNTPGFYSVTLIVFNQFGADTLTKTNYLNVTSCPLPIADFNSSVTQFCPKHCVSFSDNSSFGPIISYQWSFPGGTPDTSTSASPNVCYNQEGLYDVQLIVTNQYGSDTIIKYSEVNVQFIPNAFVSPDTAMYFGSSYQLNAGGGALYTWSPSAGLDTTAGPSPIASPTVSTVYVVSINDGTGCAATRQVTITILHDNDFFIPNTFSPNKDGSNDYFFVRGNNIYGLRLTIFDRWGEKVFETTNPSIGWDGTYKGKDLNPGAYTYVVTINYNDKDTITRSGTITLIR
jgi:gliding motility-associated-like protein